MRKWIQILLLGILGIGLILLALGYYYYVPEIPTEVLNNKYGVESNHYIQVNGMEVHFRQEGPDADTLPLVLLHGTSSSLYTWSSWTEVLKGQHRVIRVDLPGFGLTGPHPEEDYRVETYINFLQSFLSAIGVEQCIIAGNSLGGEIAWRYALKNPSQVKKLILIGAAGYPVALQEIPLTQLPFSYIWLRVPFFRKVGVNFTRREVIKSSLKYLYGNPERVTEDMVALYFDMTNHEGNREALAHRMDYFDRESPFEKIPSINTPALVIWGGRDHLIPVENAWKFHEDLPNSHLVIYPKAGHMPMEEIPEKTVKAAEEFIGATAF